MSVIRVAIPSLNPMRFGGKMISGAFTPAEDPKMSDCLNFETLAALRELEKPGQMVFTAKLINAYLNDTEERLKSVRLAHQSGNTALLAKLAHAVKGSSLNVGSDGLAALMEAIEKEAEKGTLCAAERLFRIETLFTQTREALMVYLGGFPDA